MSDTFFAAKVRKSWLILLFFVFTALSANCSDAAEPLSDDYSIEENEGDKKTTYPYVVQTESAIWYLAKADIDLLGEDRYYAGLSDLLQYMEADFADAKEALTGFISDEVPSIKIYTDFYGRAGISGIAGAYYNQRSVFIKVFSGWDMAKEALLHEYIHYLTLYCSQTPPSENFFAEAIAEYISKIVCKNRMLRSMNMGFGSEESEFYKEHGAWDEEDGCIDPKLFYFGMAQVIAEGQLVDMEYMTVENEKIVRTPQIQQNPSAKTMSFFEAGCIMAYLMDTYTEDRILTNLNMKPEEMELVLGESFDELYKNWTVWNAKRCEELGIR